MLCVYVIYIISFIQYIYIYRFSHIYSNLLHIYSQLVNRLFDDDYAYIAKRVKEVVLEVCPYLIHDPTVDMESESNTCSTLIYCNKYEECARKEQMPLHNDTLYKKGKGGEYVYNESGNSQKENTPTITLSLLDERTMYMVETKPQTEQQIRSRYEKSFLQKNWTVFFLHPLDDKPKLNNKNYPTVFQHGRVLYGGDNKMSICLAFRTATGKLMCHKRTGKVKVTKDDVNRWKHRDKLLKQAVNSGYVKNKKAQLLHLYKGACSRHNF